MLQSVIEIAKEAGGVIREAGSVTAHAKAGVGNFVTEYDTKVQQLVYARLASLCPTAAFLGEEDAIHTALPSGECFVVDPIDGTQNFINGYRHSCVSIGLVQEGEAVLGVVYDPYQDEVFCAEKRHGAFCNGVPLHASPAPLAESVLLFGASSYDRSLTRPTFRLLECLFNHALDVRSSGSAALDVCYVAAGRCNVFFEYHLEPWDYCAGSVILTEAGGRISRLGGGAVDFRKGGSLLAAGPNAYADALSLTAEKSKQLKLLPR